MNPRIQQSIQACRSGHPEAFTPLVQRYQNLALGYAYAQLGDFHQAQDVAQEAFLLAYDRLPQLQQIEAFPGWLRGIVYRCCQREFRKQRRHTPLDAAPEITDDATTTHEQYQTHQEASHLLDAIKRLPPRQRSIVTMYYLEEQSQQEVASFLGIAVSQVNNALHDARQRLKRRLTTMAADTFRAQRLKEDFANNIGEIVQIKGALIETQIKSPDMPHVFDVLGLQQGAQQAHQAPAMVVLQRRKDGQLRCMQLDQPAAPKAPLYAAGDYQEGLRLFTEARLRQAIAGLRVEAAPGILHTGIKCIDLFCPIPKGGVVGIFGKEGVGRAVFTMELIHHKDTLGGPVALAFFAGRWTAPGTQDMLQMEPAFATDLHDNVQTAWLLHPQASDPITAQEADYLDVALYFNPLLAAQGLWPALDPLHCHTNALTTDMVGKAHVDLATRAKALLQEARGLMRDPLYLELIAMDAHTTAAKQLAQFVPQRMQSLNDAQRTLVQRARKLERFLTQPFHVAEDTTGMKGEQVTLTQTLDGTRRILDGELDHIDESELLWRGAI